MFVPESQDLIRLDRRKFLVAATALVAAGVLPKSVLALAAPSGFRHGKFNLTVVSDGTVLLPWSTVSPSATPEQLKALLGARATDDGFAAELNAVLVKSGKELVLFDTGGGGYPGFLDSGKVTQSLKAAGADAGDITKVVFTHAHPDHLWGSVTSEGKMTFPNATFHMAEDEYNFWAAPDLFAKMPKQLAPIVTVTQGQLKTLKDKFATFKPGSEILPGVSVIETPGHTPGHVSFEFGGGDGLILTGDAITIPGVFFAHPDWVYGFDQDPTLASKSRRALLEYAAKGKKTLLGYHWPYPGLGYAEAKDSAFVYVPAT